jgi:hypothetical protein
LGPKSNNAGSPGLQHLQGDSLVKAKFAEAMDDSRIAPDIGDACRIPPGKEGQRNDFCHDGDQTGRRPGGLRLILNTTNSIDQWAWGKRPGS